MQLEDINRIRDQQQQQHARHQREQQHEQLMRVITTGLRELREPTPTNNSMLIKIANQIHKLTQKS